MSALVEIISTNPFVYGLEYVVKHNFPLSNDQSSFFIKGDKLVFIQTTITWIDKGEQAHTNLHFYNLTRGAMGILKYDRENDLNVFSKYNLALIGGWLHPNKSKIKKIIFD